jgi:DivIVA domain-containing protein
MAGPSEQGRRVRAFRRVPAELRNVSFPVAVRGYDRHAVDVYIARVNRLIAELEATRSPEAAVRYALARAENEMNRMIERGRDEAAEITGAAWAEADEIVARARAEAAEIVVNASAEADRTKAKAGDDVAREKRDAEESIANSQLQAEEQLRRTRKDVAAVRREAGKWADQFLTDTDAIWEERRQLLDSLRQLAAHLQAAVENATARLPLDEAPDENRPRPKHRRDS